MKSVRAIFALALPALLAGVTSAQAAPFLGNEVQLSAGGTNVFIYNSPSVGGTVGAPVVDGDLAYKGVPQNRTMKLDGAGAATGVMMSSLEDVFLGDVDWPGGTPDFYDIGISTSSAVTALDTLVPDFFATASLVGLISLGNSGVPHPCVAAPSTTCTNSTQCPPAITGYNFDITLGAGFPLLSGASDLAGNHIVSFLPGGMIFSQSGLIGACGLGDYVFQGSQSQTEAQADYLNVAGDSWCEGFALGDPAGISPSGPLADANTTMLEVNFGLLENVVEAEITDAGAATAYGPVRGGASLGVDTSTGTAMLAAHVTVDPVLAGGLCFPVASLGALPISVPVFGAGLMVNPDPTFNSTFSAWSGTGPVVGVDEGADGVFDQAEATSVALSLPVLPGGRAFMQAFVITGFGPITAVGTTVWAVDFR